MRTVRNLKHPTHWQFHQTRDDRIIWASGLGELDMPADEADSLFEIQPWTPNVLADEGEQNVLDVYFRAATAPTNFFLRLYNDTPIETDTLATLTGEVTGTGYGAITVARNTTDWPTLALDSGDYMVTMANKVFTAGGTWTAATYLVMATVGTGTAGLLILYSALGATRTLIVNDTLTVSATVKLS